MYCALTIGVNLSGESYIVTWSDGYSTGDCGVFRPNMPGREKAPETSGALCDSNMAPEAGFEPTTR